MQRYEPRPIQPLGLLQQGEWQIKCYSIVFGGGPFDRDRFDRGVALAIETLPTPARTPQRPGIAVLIAHQGNGADYVVLGWWDRENELPVRVFVREQSGKTEWRPAQGSESICVWDLEVLWAERESYVSTFLRDGNADLARAAYLGKGMTGVEPS